jgi:hypothetical protein
MDNILARARIVNMKTQIGLEAGEYASAMSAAMTFYWRWLVMAFRHPFGVADALGTALGMAIPVISKWRPTWTASMSDLMWQVPLAALSGLTIARLALAPYWMHQEAESRIERLTKELEKAHDSSERRRAIRERLSALIAEAKFYETKCLNRSNTLSLEQQIEKLSAEASNFLHSGLMDQSYWNLWIVANEHDVQLTRADTQRFTLTDGQYIQWLKWLRAKRAVLEACLTNYPPA